MEENEPKRLLSHSCATAVTKEEDMSKPLVVRIKRRRLQLPIEALWLEVSERPTKRLETELRSFSLISSDNPARGETKPSRLLFHHVDTVASFGREETARVNVLLREFQDKSKKGRRRTWAKSKQGKLPVSSSRDKHQELARKARFEQVWRSRKGVSKQDSLSELFRLYDIVRVDLDVDILDKQQRHLDVDSLDKQQRDVENRLLQDFLPLFKEYLPSVAADVESSIASLSKEEEDDYVFDVYALGDQAKGNDSNMPDDDYPMIQVVDDEDFMWGVSSDSEHDSEDSNDENNPLNDYPEDEDDSDLETVSVLSDSEGPEREKNIVSDALERDWDFVEECDESWASVGYGSSEEWDETKEEDE